MLEYSKNFTEEADQATLFQEELWGKASISYVNAVLECAASTEKELEKMQKKFRKMKEEILDFVATYDLYVGDESVSEEKKLESKRMLHLLGFHFLTEYPKLVKSSWGANILSIHEQIDAEVNIAVELAVGQLFGDDERLAEHAYYVVGFLCHAGIQEKDRRTKENDLGKCIELACSHFLAADDSNLKDLQDKLPTGLVDRRIASGGLKYPNEGFYRLFGIVERVYSRVVTTDNFMARGGILLAEIRDTIAQNKTLLDLFTQLLGEGEFSLAPEAFAYFIKVFCNLRGKDVALKYNSNLNASNTVGLRQTLAGGITFSTGKSKMRWNQSKSKYEGMKVVDLKAELKKRKLGVTGVKAVLVQRLVDDDNAKYARLTTSKAGGNGEAADGADSDDGEENEDGGTSVEESPDEAQHNAMLEARDEFNGQRDDDYNNAENISSRDVISEKLANDDTY